MLVKFGTVGVWVGSRFCGTLISETAGQIFSIRSSLELPGPVNVHRYRHEQLSIWPKCSCPWTGTHIPETAGWIFSVRSSMELSRFLVFSCATSKSVALLARMGLSMISHLIHMGLSIGWNAYLWNCWVDFLLSKFPYMGLPMGQSALKPLDVCTPFEVLWNKVGTLAQPTLLKPLDRFSWF